MNWGDGDQSGRGQANPHHRRASAEERKRRGSAAQHARRAGKSWLRLDAWKSNPALHQYYLDRGFTLVRIDDNPTDPSGVCFQRPATVELHTGPNVTEETTIEPRRLTRTEVITDEPH